MKSKVLYLRAEKLIPYLKPISFLVNSANTNLLDNIINKSYINTNSSIKKIALKNYFVPLIKVVNKAIIMC